MKRIAKKYDDHYHVNLILSVGKNLKDAMEQMPYSIYMDDIQLKVCDTDVAYAGYTDDGDFFILLSEKQEHGDIAHEIDHTVGHIMEYIEEKMTCWSSEASAYLTQKITDFVYMNLERWDIKVVVNRQKQSLVEKLEKLKAK